MDVLNFLDSLEYSLSMQTNIELLIKIVTLFQNYHMILEDPSKFLSFFVDFIERIEGEKMFWALLGFEEVFLEILRKTEKPLVIEKIIECVSSMLLSTDDIQLFYSFSNIVLQNFQRNDLKVNEDFFPIKYNYTF